MDKKTHIVHANNLSIYRFLMYSSTFYGVIEINLIMLLNIISVLTTIGAIHSGNGACTPQLQVNKLTNQTNTKTSQAFIFFIYF